MKLWNTADKWLIRTSLIFTEKRSATACSFNTCVATTLKDWQKCFRLHTLGKGYLYVRQWGNLQKEWKRQWSLLVNLSKSEQHFLKQHTLTETKNVLVVGHGSTLRKKQVLTGEMAIYFARWNLVKFKDPFSFLLKKTPFVKSPRNASLLCSRKNSFFVVNSNLFWQRNYKFNRRFEITKGFASNCASFVGETRRASQLRGRVWVLTRGFYFANRVAM